MANDPKEGATPPEPPKTADARMDAIEAEQKEQGGKIDQILDTLKAGAGGPKEPSSPPASSPGSPPASDMAEQMRQAVRDVGAERDKAAKDAEHDRQHAAAPEQPPRIEKTGKQKFQRLMFGEDPK